MTDEITVIAAEAGRKLALADPASTGTVLAEIRRQKDMARDFIVPADQLRLSHRYSQDSDGDNLPPETQLTFPLPEAQRYPRAAYDMSRIAHEQLAERTTGAYYYRKLRSAHKHADHFERDINYWLRELGGQKLLVRTLDDKVRAILSNRFFILDNYDTMIHAAMVIRDNPSSVIQRIDVTDERFFLRVLHVEHALRLDKQAGEVQRLSTGFAFGEIGDSQGHVAHSPEEAAIVQYDQTRNPASVSKAGQMFQEIALHPDWIVPGVIVKNSEVGRGGLSIEPFMYQTYCTNTAIFGKAFGRIHRSGELDDMLTDDTRRKQRDAIFGEIRDVINATFDPVQFRAHVDKFLGLQERELEHPADAVQQLKKVDPSFTEAEQQAILNAMMTQGLGTTAYALVNAVTLYAHQQPDADRRAELEGIGGKMVEHWPRELVLVRK